MKTLCLILCSCIAVWGQAPSPDPQTLQALLGEVHQLRVAMERSAAITPRIQIAIERLKLQQEQVARTSHDLKDVRDQLDRSRADFMRMQQQLQRFETAESEETDPTKKHDLGEQAKSTKLNVDEAEKSIQLMQAREGDLAAQLQSEQSRLTELNDRLDQMERTLSVP